MNILISEIKCLFKELDLGFKVSFIVLFVFCIFVVIYYVCFLLILMLEKIDIKVEEFI